MKLNRRQALLATAGAASLAALIAAPAACAHEWLGAGVVGYTEHQHMVCRDCLEQRIWVQNTWVGDKTREGWWSVADYSAAFNYHPPAERVRGALVRRLANA